MIQRLLKTDKLYTGKGDFITDGMIAIDDKNKIVTVGQNLISSGIAIEYFEGALCPGFVNTHCHLELSHLKGKVSQKTGIHNFIVELQKIRNASEEEKQNAIEAADTEMKNAGIVAVGIFQMAILRKIQSLSPLFFTTLSWNCLGSELTLLNLYWSKGKN